jgi:hypothetical protein
MTPRWIGASAWQQGLARVGADVAYGALEVLAQDPHQLNKFAAWLRRGRNGAMARHRALLEVAAPSSGDW